MKRLGLIFTYQISLEDWYKKGLLDREKNIYNHLLKDGVFQEIYWFTYGSDDLKYRDDLSENIKIIPLPKYLNFKIGKFLYSFLMPIIQKGYFQKLDFIKTNQMVGAWTALIGKILFQKKLIVRTGYLWSLFMKHKKIHLSIAQIVEALVFKTAEAVVVSSRGDQEYIINKYHLKKDKISIIHNYIDTASFKPWPGTEKESEKIIFVGRLSAQKNLANLIKALSGLPYELDIYGQGELKNELAALAEKLKVKANFKGQVKNDELPLILNRYSLFVISSFYEGMPKTLLEAMACGTACLGTEVTGIKEVIEHGKNGWLVATDSESLKKGLIKLMADKNLREQLGRQARFTILNNFDIKIIFNQEKEIYDYLLPT